MNILLDRSQRYRRKWCQAVVCIPIVAAGFLASCSHAESPPDGDQLLQDSADAMAQVSSAAFSLTVVGGDVRAIRVRTAHGSASREGRNGKAFIEGTTSGGSQIQYILTNGRAYSKTDGQRWAELRPPFSDFSLFLDPTEGISWTLGRATNVRVEGAETVDGTSCYRVHASVPTVMLRQLSLDTHEDTLPALLWIAKNGGRLVKTRIFLPSVGAGPPAELTLTLSNLNKPVTVEAPVR